MRRATLDPPRPVREGSPPPSLAGTAGALGPGLNIEHLGAPRPAMARLRRLFDPAHGWFRAIERETNILLSRHIWPFTPGLTRPYGLLLERQLTLSDAEVRVEGLPAPFDGLRVLLVTDIHTGPFLAPDVLGRTLARLLRIEPDLILLGGDFATARVRDVLRHVGALRLLRAPLGVYGVLGNHDHYTRDVARLRAILEGVGIRILHNEAVAIERDGAALALAGIDDLVWGKPDLDAALAAAAAAVPRAPVVLLSHNPDALFEAERRGAALVLAGHTHGGQIRVRGFPVLVRQSRYRLDEGRYAHGRTELIVSRGLGVTGLPVRVACPPEAILLTLRS